MPWWCALALVLAACNPPLTDRQYCVKRQMAWEEAFPDVRPSEEQRKKFVDTCITAAAGEHANGRFDHAVQCFDRLIKGRGNAKAEYLAFERCEGESR
jgi:hypothetical protein